MQVRLLGPVDVVVDGSSRVVRGLRRKAVLAVLALGRGQVVGVERLVTDVWGDHAPSTVLNTLQSNVSHLRHVLADRRLILARPPGYVLALPPRSTDVEQAEDLIERASVAEGHTGRIRLLREALALWRGPSLADVAELAWLGQEADRLDRLRTRATLMLSESRIAMGEHAEVLPELARLIRAQPFDEQLHGQLILALYRAGRQADALAAYHRLRHMLDEELGIEPGPALRALETAILQQDPALEPSPSPVVGRPDRPAVGRLRLGGPAVVGRREELATLLDLVRAVPHGSGGAVFLIGEAGIGKTRLADEVSQTAEADGLRVLRGRAAAPAVQFRPLREALLAQLRTSRPPQTPELLPYLPTLSLLVPEWRGEHPPATDESLIVLAEAALRLIIHLGGPAGTLLVLEDLHEADPDTLTVVDYLLDNAGPEQLLVLATLRPDPGDALKLARAAQHRRAASAIELSRLDDQAVRDVAAGALRVAADQVPGPVYERLRTASDGIALHVEELLAGMVSDGVLARSNGRWTVTGDLPSGPPMTLAATLLGRVDRLGPRTREFLRAAALLGPRFPPAAAGAAAALDEAGLISCLREAVEARLLVADASGDHAFRHVLTAEALREQLPPIERAALSRRAAEAVEASALSLPDGWERLAGDLWLAAGDPRRAADRFTEAARRAAAHGPTATRIELLERVLSLPEPAAEVVEDLIDAYADTGRIEDAYALGARACSDAEPARRADLHLRLARVSAAAGHWTHGLRMVSRARRLPAGHADVATEARLDVLAARLVFGNPTRRRLAAAERLAHDGLRKAEEAGRPDVACQALITLGRCARLRNLAEADAFYERGLAVAEQHHLVEERIGLLYHLGAHDGIRSADPHRLQAALDHAVRVGAVVWTLNIELELAVVRICRGEYDEARAITERCEEMARRLRLTHTRLIALGARIIAAAHQNRDAEVGGLLTTFRDLGSEDDDMASAVNGFGLAVGKLLGERRDEALTEVRRAVAHESERPATYLSFVPGPALLLEVLAGQAGPRECTALARSAHAQAGWNRQFLLLARAVLAGRAGRRTEADAAFARFVRVSRPYPLAHHLGFRLAAEAAVEDGWGDPAAWSDAAYEFFRSTAPAVAAACRDLSARGKDRPCATDGS